MSNRTLTKYKTSQHDLICDATNTNKHYSAPGNTAYESVCILLMKLEATKIFLETQESEEAKELLKYLESDPESEDFCIIKMF
jgi:hypothetical protein